MRAHTFFVTVALLVTSSFPRVVAAQVHTPGMTHPAAVDSTKPTSLSGQAAFAAIADVVRQLDADPKTDWSRVNIERLRQHLIDMDEVIMNSRVVVLNVADGARFTVRGGERTAAAIQRMLSSHAAMLVSESGFAANVQNISDGAVFTVTAGSSPSANAVARIRALGFAGLLTIGEHHSTHHIALARGDAMAEHHNERE